MTSKTLPETTCPTVTADAPLAAAGAAGWAHPARKASSGRMTSTAKDTNSTVQSLRGSLCDAVGCLGTLFNEPPGGCEADAAGATCNDGDFQ